MLPYAQTAYKAQTPSIRTARTNEYDVIARVTQRLSAAVTKRDVDFSNFIDALYRNELLWSTLASDISLPENGLPKDLRAKLFYLYRFTAEHSAKVRDSGADPAVLIEINKAVLRGLRGGSGEA